MILPGPELVRMDVLFNGNHVGESSFERGPQGELRSSTSFSIGAAKIDGTFEGKFESGRLLRYHYQGHQGTRETVLDYTPGKVSYVSGGKKGEVATTLSGPYAGSLLPQLSAEFLKSLAAMKPGEERKASVYIVDSGSVAPVVVKARPDASVRVAARDETVRRYELTIGVAEIDYDLAANGDVVAMDVPGQRLRFIVPGWGALFEDAAARHPELSQPTHNVERLRDLRMRTRDGVTLVADAVHPVGNGRYPAILERTPYGRETALALADYWAARGYVYVAQDCRGRGDSDGEWDPFVHEGKDGFDAIEWVARQPWCDGKVGTIGGSYAGTDQWQAAIERPPALRCIVPQVAAPDAMHNLPYEYGTFFLYGSLWWSRVVVDKRTDLSGVFRALPNPKGFGKLPVDTVDKAVLGRSTPVFQSWVRRPVEGQWPGFDFESRLDQANVPALHVSGWWDGDGIGTKLAWEAMRRAGRKDQWLVYGPWTHAFNTTTHLGDLDFGPTARYDLDGLTLRFFDTFLKGAEVGLDAVPRVQAFVTGANRWVSMDGWPSTESRFETYYLAPNRLVDRPGNAAGSAYTYDPAKDMRLGMETEAGTTKLRLPPKGTYALYTSPPMPKPTAIAGPFEVRLFFKSSARDTDLFATLLDVAPDGSARMIGQPGKLRASYRDSLAHPSLLKPGRTVAGTLRPWDAAHQIPTGHRLGLLIDSSMFPLYARNLGTGEPLATGRRMVKQRNVILSGIVTPSRMTFRKLW